MTANENGAIELACHLNLLIPSLDDPGLVPALTVLAEAGCKVAVLPPVDLATTNTAELRARFADHGITPVAIAGQTPDADVSSLDPAVRERGAAALREMIAFTAALGSDQLNGVPYGLFGMPTGPVSAEALEHAARELGVVADEAGGSGVVMTFEVLNRYETAAINTAAQAIAFVEASGSKNLKVHLDSFHMAVEEPDPAAAVRAAVPYLGYLELGDGGRGAFAKGAPHVRSVLSAALEEGFRGRVGIEAFSRSILPTAAADHLKIWRTTYEDGAEVLDHAVRVIRSEASFAGVAVA